MPISYVVDQSRRQIQTTVKGPVTVKDILTHFASVREEQALPFAELIDARQAGVPHLSTDEIWSAAHAVRNTPVAQSFGSRAVVVDDLVTFGLVRIFAQIVSGHVPMNVFRDMPAAEKWLASREEPQRAIQPPPTTRSS
jgi:hypothetical protein